MMQIVLKVCHRFSHRADAFRNLLMVHQYFSKRISWKTVPGHQIKNSRNEKPRRLYETTLPDRSGFSSFNRMTEEPEKWSSNQWSYRNNSGVLSTIPNIWTLGRSAALFPFCPELRSKIDQRTFRKIKMIQIYVKTLFIIRAKMLAGIIQQKSRLSHSARPLIPINRSFQSISSISPLRTGEYKCSTRYLCVLKNASTFSIDN